MNDSSTAGAGSFDAQPAAAVLQLPLRQDRTDRSVIVDARGIHVADTSLSSREFRLERAAFIVRAVNAHDDLVKALTQITNHFAAVMGGPLVSAQGVTFADGIEGIPTIAAARAAIAKAES